MPSRSARDNILAGGFVVTGIVMAVWMSFMLGARSGMGSTRSFTVRFPISIGAPGIKDGSAVLLGGQQVGRVTGVSFFPPGNAPEAVDVRVEIPDAVPVFDNAVISLERPLLGSLSSINISSAGDAAGVVKPIGTSARIDQGDIIPGGLAPPAFLAQAGIGEKQIAEIQSALSSLDSTLTRVAGLVERAGPQAEEGIADARRLVGDLRSRFSGWSDSVDRILAGVEKGAARLDPALADAQTGIADARAVIADVRGFIDGNKQRLNNLIASAESAAAKLDTVTIDTINAALADARAAIDTLDDAVARVSALIAEQTPNLRRTLANLRLMSDNLKLTAVEVRSQPWRALHAPTTKELSTQSLYDATRAYAEAASDVRAASEALAALTAAGAPALPDGTTIDLAGRTMTEAMAKYQEAEQRLMDVLIREHRK